MKIGALKEISLGERRVALTPDSAIKLQKLGHDCLIEVGAGIAAGFSDEQYKSVGVEIVNTAKELTEVSNVIVKVLPPSKSELQKRIDPDYLGIDCFDHQDLLKKEE